jgi:hypothetical protein
VFFALKLGSLVWNIKKTFEEVGGTTKLITYTLERGQFNHNNEVKIQP